MSPSIIVFACGRSNPVAARLPAGCHLLPLPCAGRISAPLLLTAFARGADGALVLGRHQPTCRLDGAEEPARDTVRRTALALELVGLNGVDRLAFVEPGPGPQGLFDAVAAFADRIASLGPSPLRGAAPGELLLGAEGLDTALDLLGWIARQPGLSPSATAWLEANGLPAAAPGQPTLLAGELPLLDLLGGPLLRPLRLPDAVGAAVAVLTRLGAAGVGIGLAPHNGEQTLTLDELLLGWGASLPPPATPARVAYLAGAGASSRRRLIGVLGHEPLDAGADPLPPGAPFALGARHRLAAEELLQRIAARGASALLVSDPRQLCRWAALTRMGTWRGSRPLPLLGVQIASLALAGQEVPRP